jgi:hypothetical protein
VSVSQLPETIHSIQNQVEHHRTRTFQQEDLAFLKRHEHSTRCRLLMPGLSFDDNICGTDNDFDRPSGTGPLCIATQALRAWLRSACPSGTKAIRPSKRQTIILALMWGINPIRWTPPDFAQLGG